MFRWHWALLAQLFLLIPLQPALAYTVRVNFTVSGSPIDPPLAGTTASGYFTFDSALIPFGGGDLQNGWNGLPGVPINELFFTWDGHTWTTSDASCFDLHFAGDGTVSGFGVGGNVGGSSTGNNCPPDCSDFLVRVYPSAQAPLFIYSAHRGDNSPFYGTLVSWDASALPFMVATWVAHGNYHAMDSYGQVYMHETPGCPGDLGAVSVIGRLSDSPLPSQVIGVVFQNDEIVATLANGDVYNICGSASVGAYVGNIFNSPGVTAVEQKSPELANAFAHNRPNPFNPNTAIPYRLASGGRVRIYVFDVSGRLVRTLEDTTRQAGQYVARWNGQNDAGESAASGTYFARIIYPGGNTAEQKMTLLR